MRKLHISLVIALLLLLAQQGAVLHEISHIRQVSPADARVHASTLADKTCELCLAFSQVANPASQTVDQHLLSPAACTAGLAPVTADVAAPVPSPRSRGPPAPLQA